MKIHELILMEKAGLSMNAIHFSKFDNLKTLDAKKHGTGIRGAERNRARDYPKLFNKNRIYFYKEDSSYRKEPGLGKYEYRVKLSKIYDMNNDPNNLRKKAIDKSRKMMGLNDNQGFFDSNLAGTLFENMIIESGFNGYWESRSNIIIYFKDVKIKKGD